MVGASTEAVVREVIRYFVRHPEAADSLEGIARWRLLEHRLHDSIDETADALEWLVARDYLQQIDIRGGRRLFKLNAARSDEAARLAAQGDLQ